MNAELVLGDAILDSELRYVNFFNGRLLSGEDLSAERAALRSLSRHLGEAVGAGVACGLEVSRAQSSPQSDVQVLIKSGLAVNKNGQVLRLECDQTVSLIRSPDPSQQANCVFSDCAPFAAGSTLSGEGYYLLTIAPASQREGLAPVSGLGNGPAACNSRYFTEGVQFRLLPMSVTPPSDAVHARNEVAYQCFAQTTRGLSDLATDAFSGKTSDTYALENLVPGKRLTMRDVPLAVIEWKSGIGFIDMWSVRRRLIRPPADSRWPLLDGDRRTSEGEAMFLQFQNQVADLMASGTALAAFKVADQFTFLPPAGLLPLTISGATLGFDYATFFSQMTFRNPIFIEGAQVRPLVREARDYPPIDTSSGLVVWLYLVRENAQAVLSSGNPPQSYLLFASGHTAYRGEAHYDVNHWNFGNFA